MNKFKFKFTHYKMSSSLLSRLAALHKVSAVSSDSNAITPGIDDAIAPNNELISDRFIDSKENENETTINSSEWFKPKSCNNSSNKQEEPSSASKNKESKGSFDTEVKLTTYATLVWAKLEGFKATGDKQLVSRFCGRICPQSWKTSNLKPDEELVEFFNLPRDFKMEHTECAVSRRFIRPFNAPFSNKITFATNPNAWSDYETEWDCASMDNLYKVCKYISI